MTPAETCTQHAPCVCVQRRPAKTVSTTTRRDETARQRRVSESTHDRPTFVSAGAVLYTTTVCIQYNYIQRGAVRNDYSPITNHSGGVAS